MGTAFEVSTAIDRPVITVWQRLVDFEQAGDWIDSVDEIACDGPCRLGTLIESHSRGKVTSSEITEFDPVNHVVCLRSERGAVTTHYRYRCDEVGPQRTMVFLTATCEVSGPSALIGRFLRRAMARSDSDQLRDLKALVESETAKSS